jgi:hypothetical protein
MILGMGGYNLRPSSTIADFKRETGSYREIKERLAEKGIEGKYVMNKFNSVWNGTSIMSKKRRKQVTPVEVAKPAHGNGVEVVDTPSTAEAEVKEARSDSKENFLLAPQPIEGAPDTSVDPDLTTNNVETPAVDAMDRHADVEPAVATGMVAAKVQQSVIPDQTLTISPGDKNINAPMEVLPEDPVPTSAAASIGPVVAAVRMVEPQTLEEKQEEDKMAEDQAQFKANGEKDMGSDAFGNLTEDRRVGKYSPADPTKQKEEQQQDLPTDGRKFKTVPLEISSNPTFDEKQEIKPQNVRTATRHPFKQVGLFRNHDMNMLNSAIIDHAKRDIGIIRQAQLQAEQSHRDLSWTRFNAPTEGVQMTEMPPQSSNFLRRGDLFPEYQLRGVNPFQPAFPPSAYHAEQMLGRF